MREIDLNPYTPNTKAQELAAAYCAEMDFPVPQHTPYVKVDEAVAKQIARFFENTPSEPDNPKVLDAYAAMVQEVSVQWNMLLDLITVEAFGDDFVPYKDSPAMMDDVLQGHLWVYDGGSDHDVLSRRENFMLRAVHDYFGHAQFGYAFGPRGEENAYVEHSKMFSPLARRALTVETRFQNAYVNFGPHSHLPVMDRPYAEQKVMWPPLKYCVRPELIKAYKDYPVFYPVPKGTQE